MQQVVYLSVCVRRLNVQHQGTTVVCIWSRTGAEQELMSALMHVNPQAKDRQYANCFVRGDPEYAN